MVIHLLSFFTSRGPVLARGFFRPPSRLSSSSSSFVGMGWGGRRWSRECHRRSVAAVTSCGVCNDMVSISDAYDGGNGDFSSARMIVKNDDSDESECDCDLVVCVRIRPDP
jgi:hypothetical protein